MIVDKLVEKAMAKAQGAQAYLKQNESTNVSFENDELKSFKSSQSTMISVKVIVDGKVGSSHTTNINDADGVVERALELAGFGGPAHFQFPKPQPGTDVKVYDEAVLPVTKDEMVSIGQEMMAMVKDYNSDIIVSAGAGKGVNRGEFANSSGVTYTTEDTNFGVHIGGQWTRGTDILWAGEGFGWKKRDIDHLEIARKAIQWLNLAENIVPIKSGDMPVIFDPQGMIVLLLSLAMGFNGTNVFLGASPLAGRLGEKIADKRLSVTDNPLMDYASSSGKYDSEGVPHQITPLIENGVVRNFLYDLDTAGRAGAKSTGHGTDRHGADKPPVGCGLTNVVIEEGDVSYEEIIKNTKEGLLVRDVMGLGQGNTISGEFSVNVQLGYKIENGEIVGRVKDVMLAGNTYDAIRNIAAIGDRAEWASGLWTFGGSIGSILTPPVQIDRLSVVSK